MGTKTGGAGVRGGRRVPGRGGEEQRTICMPHTATKHASSKLGCDIVLRREGRLGPRPAHTTSACSGLGDCSAWGGRQGAARGRQGEEQSRVDGAQLEKLKCGNEQLRN